MPPAYTGLPARDLTSLDARMPAGSRLEWTLAFDPRRMGRRWRSSTGGGWRCRRACVGGAA
ncbi:hypothetical protein AB5I41_12025 [Sphingomonas sp. MMS24-JH45]